MIKTQEEWSAYIDTLSGDPLYSKAMAANSIDFVRGMEAEGIDASMILSLFAKRFAALGLRPPAKYDGAYMDYNYILNPFPLEPMIG